MEKILAFIVFITLYSFSQNDLKKFHNVESFFHAAEVEENHVLINGIIEKLNLQIFEEIKISENLNKQPTAEAKFSLKNQVNSVFNQRIQNNIEKVKLKESLLIEMNKNFIDNILVKLIIEENKFKAIDLNDAKNYADRIMETYKKYPDLNNRLLISNDLNDKINVQIGNSLYPYLNKIFKTDVEKTLNTSLNLLAINF